MKTEKYKGNWITPCRDGCACGKGPRPGVHVKWTHQVGMGQFGWSYYATKKAAKEAITEDA